MGQKCIAMPSVRQVMHTTKPTFAVAFAVPGGQKYPAGHAAVQDDALAPDCDPNRPASHGPEQAEVDSPGLDPNRPGGHGAVHVDDGRASVSPYKPTGHRLHMLHPDKE